MPSPARKTRFYVRALARRLHGSARYRSPMWHARLLVSWVRGVPLSQV